MKKDNESETLQQEDDNSQIKSLKVLIVDDVVLDSIYLAKRVLPKMEGISVNKFYLLKMELKLLKLTNKTLT